VSAAAGAAGTPISLAAEDSAGVVGGRLDDSARSLAGAGVVPVCAGGCGCGSLNIHRSRRWVGDIHVDAGVGSQRWARRVVHVEAMVWISWSTGDRA
jgi:hypothetical protein